MWLGTELNVVSWIHFLGRAAAGWCVGCTILSLRLAVGWLDYWLPWLCRGVVIHESAVVLWVASGHMAMEGQVSSTKGFQIAGMETVSSNVGAWVSQDQGFSSLIQGRVALLHMYLVHNLGILLHSQVLLEDQVVNVSKWPLHIIRSYASYAHSWSEKLYFQSLMPSWHPVHTNAMLFTELHYRMQLHKL